MVVVQRSPSAMSLLMDALECHLLPERKAGLSSEQIRPRSIPNKTQVLTDLHILRESLVDCWGGGGGGRKPTKGKLEGGS